MLPLATLFRCKIRSIEAKFTKDEYASISGYILLLYKAEVVCVCVCKYVYVFISQEPLDGHQ